MINNEVTADMETEWRIARGQLRKLLVETPRAHPRKLAAQLGYSVGWVRKWRTRLRQTNSQDEQVLCCQAHRPKHLVRQLAAQVENRILYLRVTLSEQHHRRVGAGTNAVYLRREATEPSGPRAPCSATCWRILWRRQAISVPPPVTPHLVVRPDPGLHWEIDLCSVTPRSAEAPDKHQNGLEVFNVVDRGSSASITSLPTAHFDAELALLSIATLQQHGVPRTITLDRDPRFVRQPIDRRFRLGVHALFAVFLLCSGYAAATPP